MPRLRRLVLVFAVVLTVVLAGCAGWGTDGPNDDEPESDATDEELEESDEQDEAEQDSTDEGGDSDTEESDSGDTDASESDDREVAEESDDTDADTDEQADESDTDGADESAGDADESDADNADEQNADSSDDSDSADEPAESEPSNDATDNDSDQNGDAEETHTLTVSTTGENEGVTITVEDEDGEIMTETTDEDGTATFEVASGDYTVSGTDESGAEDRQHPTVDSDTSEHLELPGEAPPEHDVEIEVVNSETGDAVDDAQVSLSGDYHESVGEFEIHGETDSDGVLTTTAHESEYSGIVDASAYERSSVDLDVDSDTSTTVELEPTNQFHEQTLTITVVDQNGDPVAGETLVSMPGEQTEDTHTTDENGQVVLTSNTSDPSDATMLWFEVAGQEGSGSAHVDGGETEAEIDTGENGESPVEDDNDDEDENGDEDEQLAIV